MKPPTIALGIATTGRPATLIETLSHVAQQTRPLDLVVICPAKPGDLDEAALAALPLAHQIVHGAKGLAAQRNTILRAIDADIVLFIDDDFLLAPNYVAELERLFAGQPGCVAATGHVLADGATNRGYTVAEGRAIIAAHVVEAAPRVKPAYSAYGCNMAFRWSHLKEMGCTFDENLPLYAWAEDVDFSRQAARHGGVLANDAMVGVHLAEKKGRISGVRFGYSQIANQLYLTRKGTVTAGGALRKASENIAANAIGCLLNNEAWIDRRGRFLGNLLALRDMMSGRSSPTRILDF